MPETKPKSFRLPDETMERLDKLAQHAELDRTTYLKQLIKREAEKLSKKYPK